MDDTNYSFFLKCMAGLAAALLTALVIAAIVLTATGSTGAIGLAVGAAAVVFSPMVPILVIAAIAALCFTPLFCVARYRSTSNTGFFSSRPYTNSLMSSTYYPGNIVDDPTHVHSHQGSDFSDYSTNVHHHPSRNFEHPNTHRHPSVESSGGFPNVHGHR